MSGTSHKGARPFVVAARPFCICALAVQVCLIAASWGDVHAKDALPDATTLREWLINWSESFKTFSGEYELAVEEAGQDGLLLSQYQVVCRQRGDDLYFESYVFPDVSVREFSFCRLRGVNTYRASQAGQPLPAGSRNVKDDWQLPPGAYLLPSEFYGNWFELRLPDVLSAGESAVYQEGGLLLFCHRNMGLPACVDIWMDMDRTVLQIDRVIWFRLERQELAQAGVVDPIRAVHRQSSYEFGDFVELGGIKFPLWARFSTYRPKPEAAQPVAEARRNGILPRGEYVRTMLHEVPLELVKRVTFKAHGDSIRLNVRLSDSDFSLQFPEGTRLFDGKAGKVIEVRPSGLWQDWKIYVLAGIVCMAMGLMLIFLIRRGQLRAKC